MLVEGVCTEHLRHRLKRRRQRQHELFELVLVLTCAQTRLGVQNSEAARVGAVGRSHRVALTQVDHQQAPECCVEGGPAPHVAQIGLVVDPQEGEMLALEKRRRSTGQRSPSGIVGGSGRVLTVWLFNMNWTALSFTSFLTLLYVSKPELRGKTAALKFTVKHGRRRRASAGGAHQGYPRERSFSSWSVLEVIGSH